MKRSISILSVLSLAFVMTVAALGQTPPAKQTKPEHLSMVELNTLISTAKTPAEHQRIARYYQAKALDYLAQAKEHEQMVAAYKAYSSLSNDKNRASTIDHCEYYVRAFKDLAVKTQELAQLHGQMAQDAEQK
jgi:hypothetical protein